MRILLCLLVLALASGNAFAQNVVQLTGKIGKYSIEMELQPSGKEDGNIKGRYRYAGKTSYLDLKGDYYGGIFYLEESYNGEVTGRFYMETGNEAGYEGKWIGTKSALDASLSVKSGSMSSLEPYDVEAMKNRVSNGITGSYISEYYFINDMWYSDDDPQLEIGFNGGVVTAEERGPDSVYVYFNLTCGPTYHMAYFSGMTGKIGPNKYKFSGVTYGDEPCVLLFEFKPGTVEIFQESSSMDCGFGARAYAEGSYEKVNDKVVKDEDLSIRDVLQD